MIDADLLKIGRAAIGASSNLDLPLVRVTAGDYAYTGWIVGVSVKRSGAVRATVEDIHGRLFIHNAGQLVVVA